jgi:hypothetical protein
MIDVLTTPRGGGGMSNRLRVRSNGLADVVPLILGKAQVMT